jgi:hypothetical protein
MSKNGESSKKALSKGIYCIFEVFMSFKNIPKNDIYYKEGFK